MRTARTLTLLFVLGYGCRLPAEDVVWRAASPSTAGQASTARPRLGKPEPIAQTNDILQVSGIQGFRPVIRAQSPMPVPIVPAPSVPPPAPPSSMVSGTKSNDEAYNCAQATDGALETAPAAVTGLPAILVPVRDFWSTMTTASGTRGLFQSTQENQDFITPVTSPLMANDPRALTEVRPFIMWQDTRNSNSVFAGGDIFLLGLQASVALTDRLAVRFTEVGWMWSDPKNPVLDFTPSSNGFAELHIAPQYTFINNDASGTILAGGVDFQLALGSGKVQQDTGDLSIRPYVSFGQRFLDFDWGVFHFVTTAGYAFSTDNMRSDHFDATFHLDFDIAKQHWIYPFIEVNWMAYTGNGKARALDFEGRDLFNFGSTGVAGHSDLSIAAGARFRFNEHVQLGAAAEFPLLGNRDLMNFRLTFDVIFRY